jgi:hypothetical protein
MCERGRLDRCGCPHYCWGCANQSTVKQHAEFTGTAGARRMMAYGTTFKVRCAVACLHRHHPHVVLSCECDGLGVGVCHRLGWSVWTRRHVSGRLWLASRHGTAHHTDSRAAPAVPDLLWHVAFDVYSRASLGSACAPFCRAPNLRYVVGLLGVLYMNCCALFFCRTKWDRAWTSSVVGCPPPHPPRTLRTIASRKCAKLALRELKLTMKCCRRSKPNCSRGKSKRASSSSRRAQLQQPLPRTPQPLHPRTQLPPPLPPAHPRPQQQQLQ